MFKVQIDEDEYEITFRHFSKTSHSPGTSCFIQKGAFIRIGETILHPKDNYNRNIGRKMSMARALKEGFFTKEQRTLFWDKYFEVRGKIN